MAMHLPFTFQANAGRTNAGISFDDPGHFNDSSEELIMFSFLPWTGGSQISQTLITVYCLLLLFCIQFSRLPSS